MCANYAAFTLSKTTKPRKWHCHFKGAIYWGEYRFFIGLHLNHMPCGQTGRPMKVEEGQTSLQFDSNQGYSRDISQQLFYPCRLLVLPTHPQTISPSFSPSLSLCLYLFLPKLEQCHCLRNKWPQKADYIHWFKMNSRYVSNLTSVYCEYITPE